MRAAVWALVGVALCAAMWCLNLASQPTPKPERRGALMVKPMTAQAKAEAWARARESELRDEYEPVVAAALPDATDLKIVCRMPKCRIELTVPRAQHEETLALLQSLHLGDQWIPEIELQCPGTATVGLTLAFAN